MPWAKRRRTEAWQPEQTEDVRLDLADKNTRDVGTHLIMTWPQCAEDEGVKLSGVSCLTMVIRCLYAYLGARDWDKLEHRSEITKNPFLAYAWRMFDGPHAREDQEKHLNILIDRVWSVTLGDLAAAGRAHELSFEALLNSEAMAQTVWSWPEVQRWGRLLWKRRNEESWTTYDPDTAPPRVRSWFREHHPVVLPKHLEKTLLPSTDISKDVNDGYRSLSTESGGLVAVPEVSEGRRFLFMMYKVGELQGGEKITIEQMHTLRVPRRDNVEMEDGRTLYTETSETDKFSLLTMVKLRDHPDDCDLIQMYDVAGVRVRPNHVQNKIRGYVDNTWKVEDLQTGMRVFLLYVHDPSDTISRIAMDNDMPENDISWEPDAIIQEAMNEVKLALEEVRKGLRDLSSRGPSSSAQ